MIPGLGLNSDQLDVHGIYIPEMTVDLEAEGKRLRAIMDKHDCVNFFISEGIQKPSHSEGFDLVLARILLHDCVNLFISEGAGVDDIIKRME
ncbi:hypothetical protein T484DRAFT_1863969, partial [Baffinella frigidus]